MHDVRLQDQKLWFSHNYFVLLEKDYFFHLCASKVFLLFREFQERLVTVKMLFFLPILKLYAFFFAKAPDVGKTFVTP